MCSLVAVATLAPARVVAQPIELEGRETGGWTEVFDAGRRMGLLYRRHGLAKLVEALSSSHPELGDAPQWLVLEQALVRFERARRLIPDDPELAYYTAYALTRWERQGPDGRPERRVEEAIEAWHRLRELAPTYMPAHVAYELAMLHMRRHEFEEARAEYDATLRNAIPPTVHLADRFYMSVAPERALMSLFSPHHPANLHSNLAEVTMLTGDVDAALGHYRDAIEMAEDPVTRCLGKWGLSVALSRSDEHNAALEAAYRAIREDPIPPDDPRFRDLHRMHGPFAVLHLDGVFFEPPYEVHAYTAIGHEAWARDPDVPREEQLRRALRSWRLFLAEGGTTSRFASHARQHIARLEAELD